MWKISEEWGRTNVFNDNSFNPDPRQRQSFWSLIIGNILSWLVSFGTNQISYQRYSALPTLGKARCSVLLNIIGMVVLVVLTCLAGISVFAYYADQGCDPLSAKEVASPNHLIPYFVMDKLAYPGVPGLFIASLFSGALSSVSSCLTALSSVTWDIFLEPTMGKYLTDSQKAWVTRITVLVYGGVGIGLSFLCTVVGGTVVQLIISFFGAVNGPLLTLFLFGALCRWINWIGASVGAVVGLGFMFWVVIGSYLHGTNLGSLHMPTANCTAIYGNATGTILDVSTNSTLITASPISGIENLYAVSYLWTTVMGFIVSSVIAFIISLLTGGLNTSGIKPKYMIPVADYICCCLPESVRRKLRCEDTHEYSLDRQQMDGTKACKLTEIHKYDNATFEKSANQE